MATTKKGAGSAAKKSAKSDIKARVKVAIAHIAEARKIMSELVGLTADQRVGSQGRMRVGEEETLGQILDVVDARPALFTSLADKDGGNDPEIFETDLLREHLAEIAALAPLKQAADSFASLVDDSVLSAGAHVRPVTLAAYHIAKTHAATDAGIAEGMREPMKFYGAAAAKAARTKKLNKTKK